MRGIRRTYVYSPNPMFDVIKKFLTKKADDFLGTEDFKEVLKETGPINPADIRRNESKYADLMAKAKAKRLKMEMPPSAEPKKKMLKTMMTGKMNAFKPSMKMDEIDS